MFADAVLRGDLHEAIIDTANMSDQPAGRPDLRRVLVPIGPVAVFAASNFPLAFSVLGGDTASALAAGCPVVVKAHPGHPQLSTFIGDMARSVTGDGVLAVVHGLDAGSRLVQHPAIQAVGFTGSAAGGRALLNLATARPDPIPFYGELGSLNPVVVTPGAVRERGESVAAGLVDSFTRSAGQFCTKPGLVLLPEGHGLTGTLRDLVRSIPASPMLTPAIAARFADRASALPIDGTVRCEVPFRPTESSRLEVLPMLVSVAASSLDDTLLDEWFGPVTVIVEYADTKELLDVIERLPGTLTATVHAASSDDTPLVEAVIAALAARCGRLIFGGWPTGVAVTWAMQHGGPWPSSTNSLHTSVGVVSARRFLRPISFQNTPDALLPPSLRNANPLGLFRRINGQLARGPISQDHQSPLAV